MLPYKPQQNSKRTARRKKRNNGQLLPGRKMRRATNRLNARLRSHPSGDTAYRKPGAMKLH